jgi:hypothetical protein
VRGRRLLGVAEEEGEAEADDDEDDDGADDDGADDDGDELGELLKSAVAEASADGG